jgi:hypothetical protein
MRQTTVRLHTRVVKKKGVVPVRMHLRFTEGKYYVLHPASGLGYPVIKKLKRPPTDKRFGEKYGFAEGGFKTKGKAKERADSWNAYYGAVK